MFAIRFFRSLLGCLILLDPCLAQQSAGQTGQPVGGKVAFKVYTWALEDLEIGDQPKIEQLFYRHGEKYEAMELQAAALSPEYDASLDAGQLVFYRKVMVDNKETYQSVVSALCPPAAERLFIYLFPSNGKLNLLPINTSLRAFPQSRVLFINSANQQVKVDINGATVLVKPRDQVPIDYKLNDSETLRIVTTSTTEPKRNLAVMTVGARKDQRIIAFFYSLKDGHNHRLLLERGVDNQAAVIAQ